MIQRHSIILWKKAETSNKKFEDISKEMYEALNIFRKYPQELRPNYLVAKSPKNIERFDWNYENFRDVLKIGINREGKRVFEDLGYSISFFSSMNEKESCAFRVKAGNKNENFYNTLVVELPVAINLFDIDVAREISKLFNELVQVYMPFWGCISNKVISRRYEKFLLGEIPTTVHWMNYWSEGIVYSIGMEKIQKVIDENIDVTFENNVLSIKDTAFNVNDEKDMNYYNSLHKQLFVYE